MLRLGILVVTITTIGLLPFDAYAWMEDWAPEFKCAPAQVEVLSKRSVSNFVSTVHFDDMDFYWKYCEGYKLDLNDDGIKDFVFILPCMGCGLAAQGYDVYFKVSTDTRGWKDSFINGYGVSKDDIITVGGKTYFRHSMFYGNFEKSKHNHWVHQVFSFNKNGAMVCSNDDFGKLFPAVTIYYINPKFRQIELTKSDLKNIADAVKSMMQITPNFIELLGPPCRTIPEEPELLYESGGLALYAGETDEDSAYNKARGSEPLDPCRNSLFLRQRKTDGTDEWRVLLTTGSNWREAAGAGADGWCSDRALDVKNCFYVWRASFSSDGRRLWLVCDPHTYTYRVVCSYDVYNRTFRVLIDGDDAEEESDGTIRITGKKFYPNDDLGAAWHDVWIDSNGNIVRKGDITLRGCDI